MVKELSLIVFLRSPLVRMVLIVLAEKLAALGWIAYGDVSQFVEDAINIISFLGVVVYLAIYQWRTHHPAKAQLEEVLPPVTPEEVAQVESSKRSLNTMLKALIDKIVVVTPKTPQQ